MAFDHKKVSDFDLPDWVKRKVAHVWETGWNILKLCTLWKLTAKHKTGIRHRHTSPWKVTFRDDEFRQSIRVSTIASPYWSPTLAPRWWIWWSAGEAGEVQVDPNEWVFFVLLGMMGMNIVLYIVLMNTNPAVWAFQITSHLCHALTYLIIGKSHL